MKTTNLLLLTTALLVLQLTAVSAQVFTVKNYRVTIAGTSTLHDWESNVEKLECKGSIQVANSSIADLKDIVVQIPVRSIKSTKGKIMDTKTWEAFDHENHPFITFVLTGKKINTLESTAEVTGNLTMAGITNQVDLALVLKALPGGQFIVTGSKTLLMSDFNMVPPTAMMGTIKVGPEVTVSFEVIINPNNTL